MKILTGKDIRQADISTVQNEPVSGIDLMERAAEAITEAILHSEEHSVQSARAPAAASEGDDYVIFAGKGNNGGDGLAVARLLYGHGHGALRVSVVVAGKTGDLSEECRINLGRLPSGIRIFSYSDCVLKPSGMQDQGNAAYCLHVIGDIIAFLSVAPCHGVCQLSVFVGQRDGSTVVLQLATYLEIFVQPSPYPVVEVCYVCLRIGVSQRQHRVLVLYLPEVFAQIASDPHGRRILVGIFGVRLLQFLQFAHQVIKLFIRNLGVVQHIVLVVVPMQFGSKPVYLFFYSHGYSLYIPTESPVRFGRKNRAFSPNIFYFCRK